MSESEHQTAAKQERVALHFHPTCIPNTLLGEIVERYRRGFTTRRIARWLVDEQGIESSHASVGRAINRYWRDRLIREGESDTLLRIEAQQDDFERAMETMERINDYAIDTMKVGEAIDPATEASFRMAYRRSLVLQRAITENNRRFAMEQRGLVHAEHLQALRLKMPAEPRPSEPSESSRSSLAGVMTATLVMLIGVVGWWSCAVAPAPSPKVALYAPERGLGAVSGDPRTALAPERRASLKKAPRTRADPRPRVFACAEGCQRSWSSGGVTDLRRRKEITYTSPCLRTSIPSLRSSPHGLHRRPARRLALEGKGEW